MEPRRRLSLSLRSLRRLPLQRAAWSQRGRRHLYVLRRTIQLLQLRQLGVSAVLRVIEHAMVLQWAARSDLPDRKAEDRVLADQWMAVVRHLQQAPGCRISDPLSS